jgi:hypothetical protein
LNQGHLLWANVLILAGDLLNAAAGTSARLGLNNVFWLIMASGWLVFFTGVLLTGHRAAVTKPTTQDQDLSSVKGRVASV